MILTRAIGIVLTSVSLAFGAPTFANAQTPSASPSPSAAPSPAAAPTPAVDRAKRVHPASVTCPVAPFVTWPDRSGVPNGTAYPPARDGEVFNVIGDGTLSTNGTTYYETMIDVFSPYGTGKHFYISAYCVNAG